MKYLFLTFITLCFLFKTNIQAAALPSDSSINMNIIYVDADAVGANDGSSWNNAYVDLQDGLGNAIAGNHIWVAEGIYIPDLSDRKAYFNVPDQVHLYGGFDGTETALEQRAPNVNVTILSGDLLGNDNTNILDTETTRQDNSYHIIALRGDIQGIIVDGFTISGGNANGITDECTLTPEEQYNDKGGAIYINPFNMNDSLSANFNHCILEKNTGLQYAAYYIHSSCGTTDIALNVHFESCIIRNNYSDNFGIMYFAGSVQFNAHSYGSIVNSLIHDNHGAPCLRLSSGSFFAGTESYLNFDLINTTISNNTAESGRVAVMFNVNNFRIINSIIFGNGSDTPLVPVLGSVAIINNSIVEGSQQGGLDVDPLFADTLNNDFSLMENSPAIDAGDTTGLILPQLDLAGNSRISSIIDMGAYEFSSKLYVDHTATGSNDGSSWLNAFTDLQDALAIGSGKEILVAKGTYKPTDGTTRGIAFEIPDAAKIYGGYPNGGGSPNPTSNETILSGDIDNVSSYAGNSYHVVIVRNVDNVILDGLSIREGNADNANSFGRSRGGGLFVNNATLTLNNLDVKWNKGIYGAGMFATLSGNVTVNESTFKKNTGDYGSAIYHSNQTNLYLIKSRIINNTSLVRVAVEVNNSLFTRIENSVIANNASMNANAIGFIATNRNGSAEIVNSTILGESNDKNLITMQVGFGDQLDLFVDNSIIGHQNANFTKAFKDFNNGVLNLLTNNCYIQGSSIIGTSNNNLYSATDGALLLNADFSLNPCSPGIDAGSNALLSGTTDIDGNDRIFNTTVDMGAFEANAACRLAFEKKNLNSMNINIFPNPTNDLIFIETDLENLTFQIYNLLGKNILNTSEKVLDLSQYPSGVYMLKIINQEELITSQKIIKK